MLGRIIGLIVVGLDRRRPRPPRSPRAGPDPDLVDDRDRPRRRDRRRDPDQRHPRLHPRRRDRGAARRRVGRRLPHPLRPLTGLYALRGNERVPVSCQPSSRHTCVSTVSDLSSARWTSTPLHLVAATGPRPSEPRGGHEHAGARAVVEHLELAPVEHRRLVDVAAHDQIRSRGRKPAEDGASPGASGSLRSRQGAPGQLVVDRDDAERARLGTCEQRRRPVERLRADPAALIAPGIHRVHADDLEGG